MTHCTSGWLKEDVVLLPQMQEALPRGDQQQRCPPPLSNYCTLNSQVIQLQDGVFCKKVQQMNNTYLQSKQTESPDIRTTSTGLVISNDHPWLAASPDGLVYDPLEDPPNRVVEFKNPYSVRNLTLCEAAIKAKGFCLQYNHDTNKVGLKKIMTTSIRFDVPCIAPEGSGVI